MCPSDECPIWRRRTQYEYLLPINQRVVSHHARSVAYVRAHDQHGVVGVVQNQLQAFLDELFAYRFPRARGPRRPEAQVHLAADARPVLERSRLCEHRHSPAMFP